MKGRSLIGKRCSCCARHEPQFVFDGGAPDAVLARIDQHVGADLGEGSLEQDEVAIVGRPAGALAQQLDRMVERVKAVLEAGERGVEFERWGGDGDCVRSQ